jgi:hypothetical protein
MSLTSALPVAVAVPAVVEEAGCCRMYVGRGSGCSSVAGVADTVVEEEPSSWQEVVQELACRHDCWKRWVVVEAGARPYARRASTLAAVVGAVGCTLWSFADSSAAVESDAGQRRYAPSHVGLWNARHLLATAASTASPGRLMASEAC